MIPTQSFQYRVAVRCHTFNHADYILDALNGFVMQKTDFPFVILLMDDASTDGTREIIQSFVSEQFDTENPDVAYERDCDYAYIQHAQHKENKQCFIVAIYLKFNHYSRRIPKFPLLGEWRQLCQYEAICEGDDYWIDANKLQKQFDFMESHPEHSLCFHAIYRQFNDGRKKLEQRYKHDVEDCPAHHAIMGDGGYISTNSMFFRMAYRNIDYPQWATSAPVGDLPLMLVMMERGKLAFMKDVMAVYRVCTPGSWSSKRLDINYHIAFNKKIKSMWIAYDEYSHRKHHLVIMARLAKNRIMLLIKQIKNLFKKH